MWRWGASNSRPENDLQACLQGVAHSEDLSGVRRECARSRVAGLSFFRRVAGVNGVPDLMNMTLASVNQISAERTVVLAV